jgi:putative component of membrane protein insertase Oxa1/YidC/SpoIIIJ protein YidD
MRKCPVVLVLVLLAAASVAGASHSAKRPAEGAARPYAFHRPLTVGAIRLYQLTLSRARVVACPMHPHCSAYGRQAFERRNPLHAGLSTADRLLRCGHDLDRYEPVAVGNRLAFADPLDMPDETEAVPVPPAPGFTHPALDVSEADARLLGFADALLEDGRPDAALVEYERLLVYFPQSPLRGAARLAVFDCHLDAGRPIDALSWGRALLSTQDLTAPERLAASMRTGLAALRAQRTGEARGLFDAVAASEAEPSVRARARLLSGVALAHEGRWREASDVFASLEEGQPLLQPARELEAVARRAQRAGRKSPRLAAALGIVPGLGYLYSGYRGSALSAFVVNGLFFWATAEAISHDHMGLAATLGTFGSGWYLGSIYGGAVTAKRANLAAERARLDELDVALGD